MKAGLITSTAMHAVILGLGFLLLSSPVPFDAVQTEPLPVSLVPLSDQMSVRKGDMTAAKAEKLAPRPTRKPPKKPHEVEATLPLLGTPDVRPDITPQEKPEEKKNNSGSTQEPEIQPKFESPPVKPLEKPVEEVEEKIGQKAVEKAEQKPVEPPQPQREPAPVTVPSGKIASPSVKPQQAAKPKKETGQPSSAARGDTLDNILAMNENALVDKTRTQSGGAQRSEEPAAFGSARNIGNQDNLQKNLNNIIGFCVARNWDIGIIQGNSAYDLRVRVHFRLNRDGTLNGEPDLAPAGGDTKDREVIAVQALTALKKCAPFALPADKYNQWHDVTINMKAFPD